MQPPPGGRSPAERWRIAASRVVVAAPALLWLSSETAWHAVSVPAAHAVSLFGILLAALGVLVWIFEA